MDYTSYDIAKDIFLSSLDKLPSEDDEQLTQYLLDFIGKDYFAANSAYNRHIIDSPKVAEYHYKVGLWVAYALTKSQFIQKLAFENKDFCPAEFLNAVSYFGSLWLGSMRKDWYKLVINELKSVSFSKMLSDGSRMVNHEVSEVEFYDCLTTCSPRTMSLCLTHVDTDAETKRTLKDYLLDGNEDQFITTLIKSKANFAHVASVLSLFCAIRPLAAILSVYESSTPIGSGEELSAYELLFKPHIESMPNEDLRSMRSIIDWKQSNYTENKNKDWFIAYSHAARCDSYFLFLHSVVSQFCNDVESSMKLSEYIQNDKYLKDIYNGIVNDYIDVLCYNPNGLETLLNYRKEFIDGLVLPLNVEGKKDSEEYYDSNRKPDLNFCKKMYFALVENNLLSYDVTTYYSFVYRTCRKYRGEEAPNRIVWWGQPKDLYYLIYWFVDGANGKVWKKTKSFFIDSNGNEFHTNGVKNQADKPTPLMEKLIKELEDFL